MASEQPTLEHFLVAPDAYVADQKKLAECFTGGYTTKHCVYCGVQVDPTADTIVTRASQTHIRNAAAWREAHGVEALHEVYHICPPHQVDPPVTALGLSVQELKQPDLPKPRPKLYRSVFGPLAVVLAWVRSLQNSLLWHTGRSGSSGGSGKDNWTGDSAYTDVRTMFDLETGAAPVCQSSRDDDMGPCDHGHATEEEAARIYSVMMGAVTFCVGLFLHWMFPFYHVSVDRVAWLRDHARFPNFYTKNDSRKGISEQKCLQHSCIITKDGLRPTVSTEKVLQAQDQARIMGADWVDLSVLWKCRPRDPRGQPRQLGPRTYLVGEYTIVRVYRSNAWTDILYRQGIRFIAAVRSGVLPPDLAKITVTSPIPLPDVVLLPLHWIQCVMTIPDHLPDVPVDPVTNHLTGTWQWTKVKDFYFQKPLQIAIKDLRSKSSKAIELDSAPKPEPLPQAAQMKNPLYVDEFRKQPTRDYKDMIFDLCWEHKSASFDPLVDAPVQVHEQHILPYVPSSSAAAAAATTAPSNEKRPRSSDDKTPDTDRTTKRACLA